MIFINRMYKENIMADHEEYSDFDFGFTAADEDELNSLMGADTDDVTSEEIMEMKEKLDLILQMNSTCDGANQVKEQYDELMEADAKQKAELEQKRLEHEEELFIIDLQKAFDTVDTISLKK